MIVFDYDVNFKFHVNCYCYKEPLAYQIFPCLKIEIIGCINYPIIGTLFLYISVWLIELLGLDKKHEPGTILMFTISMYFYTISFYYLPLFTLYVIIYSNTYFLIKNKLNAICIYHHFNKCVK